MMRLSSSVARVKNLNLKLTGNVRMIPEVNWVKSPPCIVRRTVQTINKGIGNFRIAELFDAINDKLAEHPPLRFLVFASALCCALPVTMFIIFGVTSAVIMFAGFLFIEGTLLALGGLCMFLCILSLILVLSAFAMILGVFYMLALKLGYVLNGFEETSNKMQKSLSSLITERKRTQLSHMIADAHQD